MRVYWKLGDIPELAPFDAKQRGRIWRRVVWRVLLRPLPLSVLITFSFAMALVLEAVRARFESLALQLTAAALLSAGFGFPFGHWLAERSRPHIREVLDQPR